MDEVIMSLNTFIYKDELYIRLIPAKNLFRSTMVHEVVNRGDVFAMRVRDQQFTVVPGTAAVEHTTHHLVQVQSEAKYGKSAHTTEQTKLDF